jgi:hypothetical protein
MASEGVVLDIIGGNAIFTSLLTNHVILTRCLKTIKSNDDLNALINELNKKSWFDSEMKYFIKNEVEILLRGI